MHDIRLYILALLVAFLQVSIFANLGGFGSGVNLLALLLIWFAFNRPQEEAYIIAVVGGLLLDVFSAGFLGLNVLTLGFFATILYFVTSRFLSRELRLAPIVIFYLVSIIAYEFLTYLVLLLASTVSPQVFVSFPTVFGSSVLWQILYSFVFVYPLIYLSRKILKHIDLRIE